MLEPWVNIYYHPEKFGLIIFDKLECSDNNYQFDTRVVWKTENGSLLTARDSGCSCPSPFEEIHSSEGLDAFNFEEIKNEIAEEVSKLIQGNLKYGSSQNPNLPEDSQRFLQRTHRYIAYGEEGK